MNTRGLRRALGILLLLVAMLIAFGWVVRRTGESKLATAKVLFESEVGSLRLRDYALPEPSENENCALWLERATEVLVAPAHDPDARGSFLDREWGTWSEQERADAGAWIETNQEALSLLEPCLEASGSSFGFRYEEGFDAEVPPMLELYRIGRLAATDLRLAVLEGDIERVSRDTTLLRQLSTSLARESFLVSALLHLGVERLRVVAAEDVLEAEVVDPTLLRQVRDHLGSLDSAEALRRSLGGEAAAVLKAVENRDPATLDEGRLARTAAEVFEPGRLAELLDFYREIALSVDAVGVDRLDPGASSGSAMGTNPHLLVAPNILAAVDKLRTVERDRDLLTRALDLRLESLGYPHGS